LFLFSLFDLMIWFWFYRPFLFSQAKVLVWGEFIKLVNPNSSIVRVRFFISFYYILFLFDSCYACLYVFDWALNALWMNISLCVQSPPSLLERSMQCVLDNIDMFSERINEYLTLDLKVLCYYSLQSIQFRWIRNEVVVFLQHLGKVVRLCE
jgi:hypothetical protein